MARHHLTGWWQLWMSLVGGLGRMKGSNGAGTPRDKLGEASGAEEGGAGLGAPRSLPPPPPFRTGRGEGRGRGEPR